MSLKSVHITNHYHKNSGGVSTAYNKLLEAANRRKRHVRLIVPGAETEIEEVGEYGRIYYIKAGFSPIIDKRYRILIPWKTYMPDGSPIKTILRDEKPDLIEIGEKYFLSLMAGLLRKRQMNVSQVRPMLVQYSHERMDDSIRTFMAKGRAFDWFASQLVGNYIVPMFDFHIANSDYTSQELIDSESKVRGPLDSASPFNIFWRYWRAPKSGSKDRVYVNQCGVDNDLFTINRQNAATREKIHQDNKLPDEALILLYAGRLSPEKNIALLPKLMKILRQDQTRDFRLLVAGSGPSAETLAAQFEKLAPGAVTMLGHISDKNDLAGLFANCDAFVHPNPHEPFGITPLEAMASGLPVVAPNSGGVLSYADNENSWLAEPNAESFAAAVLDVFSGDDKRIKKIEQAITTSRKYSWEDSTDRLFALYDKIYEKFTANRELYDYETPPPEIDFSR